jgi:uncharacterized Zn-binding protein involved in type VI secretion
MGTPAVVLGDRISGMCATHMVPSPSGSPMPSPGPLPFSAPLTTGLTTTVLVAGKPAAVQGSSGVNTPPHVGLHPSDPFLAPPAQQGRVVAGSGTVFLNGRPAAYTGCQVTSCSGAPGQVAGTAATVLIGQ